MGDLSPWHLLIIAVVLVLLFGSRKLPGAAKSLGQSLKIFKEETKGLRGEDPPALPAAGPAPGSPTGTSSGAPTAANAPGSAAAGAESVRSAPPVAPAAAPPPPPPGS